VGKIVAFIKTNKLIVFILLMASALRLTGIKPGYNQYHSDEPVIYEGAVNMIKNKNLFPGYYYYGSVPITINSLIFRTVFIPLGWLNYYSENIFKIIDGKIHLPIAPLEAKRILQVEIFGEREINAIFWSRFITALFGIGCVYLLYLLGKKVFGKKVGLLAAFLLVFNFKHVVNSHLGLPDIYNSFFLLLSMIFTYRLWRDPSKKNYLLAGIFAGFSFSVKYQFYSFFPYILAHFYRVYQEKKDYLKNLFDPYFIAGGLVIPLIFLLTNPYYFINIKEAIYQNSLDVKRYSLGANELNLYPLFFLAKFDYGYPQLVLLLLGLFISLIKNFKKALFLFFPLFLYIFIFFYYSRGGFFVRNAITTTPIAMVYISYTLNLVFEFISNKLPKFIFLSLLIVTLILMVYIPAKNSILNVYAYAKPWTYQVMHDWMDKNISSEEKIAVDAFDWGEFPKKLNYLTLDFDYFYSKAELEEMGAEWVVYNLFRAGKPFYFWMNFSLKDLQMYWKKPVQIMRNMYPALVIEEVARYRLFEAVKSWQAPDMNLIIAKFPQWPKVDYKNIASYTTEKDFFSWRLIDELNSTLPKFSLDVNCYDDKACIIFFPGSTKYPTIRFTSDFFEVQPGHLYEVKGFIRSEKNLEDIEREGFLRIDFYQDKNDITKAGSTSSVSSRVYGSVGWQLKKIIDKAPQDAKYMTVSFSVYNPNLTKFWFDDVTINESIEIVKDVDQSLYLKNPLDLDLLFPNSHGNL